ncbi:hypothetical protein [Methylomonas sp. MgM2]
MVAFSRQFLVMLLVLLQFAAPLVHAHVHDLETSRGFHLHEFEALQFKSDTAFLSTLDYAGPIQSAVVEMGSAIKAPQNCQALPPIYSGYDDAWLPKQYLVDIINFSPHETVPIADPFLDHPSSRAPPRQI